MQQICLLPASIYCKMSLLAVLMSLVHHNKYVYVYNMFGTAPSYNHACTSILQRQLDQGTRLWVVRSEAVLVTFTSHKETVSQKGCC